MFVPCLCAPYERTVYHCYGSEAERDYALLERRSKLNSLVGRGAERKEVAKCQLVKAVWDSHVQFLGISTTEGPTLALTTASAAAAGAAAAAVAPVAVMAETALEEKEALYRCGMLPMKILMLLLNEKRVISYSSVTSTCSYCSCYCYCSYSCCCCCCFCCFSCFCCCCCGGCNATTTAAAADFYFFISCSQEA